MTSKNPGRESCGFLAACVWMKVDGRLPRKDIRSELRMKYDDAKTKILLGKQCSRKYKYPSMPFAVIFAPYKKKKL